MTGAAKDTRFGMPYVTSPRADAHIHCCSGVVGHPHGAMMRSTWPGHTKIEHSAHDRARLTVNPGLVVAARIDRNRHSAVYRRAASKTYNDRWDTLCEKANLSTADFWHYHHSMDKRLPPLRLVLYEDSGTPPCHRSAARWSIFAPLHSAANHCDLEERQHLLGQLNDLCHTASALQPIIVVEVTEAIRLRSLTGSWLYQDWWLQASLRQHHSRAHRSLQQQSPLWECTGGVDWCLCWSCTQAS